MSSPLPQGFNPHSRTGSDPSSEDMAASVQRFNPHSRTGSDRPRPALRRSFRVSIHTPARGVTITHTSGFWRTFCFNPHSRTGSDRQERRQPLGYRTVSIHTPARGVTAKTDNPICFCKAKIITNKQKISFLKIFLSFQHSFLHFSRCESYNKKMFTQYPHRLKN